MREAREAINTLEPVGRFQIIGDVRQAFKPWDTSPPVFSDAHICDLFGDVEYGFPPIKETEKFLNRLYMRLEEIGYLKTVRDCEDITQAIKGRAIAEFTLSLVSEEWAEMLRNLPDEQRYLAAPIGRIAYYPMNGNYHMVMWYAGMKQGQRVYRIYEPQTGETKTPIREISKTRWCGS